MYVNSVNVVNFDIFNYAVTETATKFTLKTVIFKAMYNTIFLISCSGFIFFYKKEHTSKIKKRLINYNCENVTANK